MGQRSGSSKRARDSPVICFAGRLVCAAPPCSVNHCRAHPQGVTTMVMGVLTSCDVNIILIGLLQLLLTPIIVRWVPLVLSFVGKAGGCGRTSDVVEREVRGDFCCRFFWLARRQLTDILDHFLLSLPTLPVWTTPCAPRPVSASRVGGRWRVDWVGVGTLACLLRRSVESACRRESGHRLIECSLLTPGSAAIRRLLICFLLLAALCAGYLLGLQGEQAARRGRRIVKRPLAKRLATLLSGMPPPAGPCTGPRFVHVHSLCTGSRFVHVHSLD